MRHGFFVCGLKFFNGTGWDDVVVGQVITAEINGTNDAAVIGVTSSSILTETNAVLSTSGMLSVTDMDSSATFAVVTNVAGDHGYGLFSINSAGLWQYTSNTAHNGFVAGTDYIDSLTFHTADGMAQALSVRKYCPCQ